jgi:hypothetical protein
MMKIEKKARRDRRRWLKRQAVQITGMLPEDPVEAGKVLRLSKRLVGFLEPRRKG